MSVVDGKLPPNAQTYRFGPVMKQSISATTVRGVVKDFVGQRSVIKFLIVLCRGGASVRTMSLR